MHRFIAVVFCVGLFGCVGIAGSSGGGSAGPCAGDEPLPECGESCDVDSDCSLGLHCGTADECTAECSDSEDCDDGQTCTARGRCTTGNDEDPACAIIDVNVAPEVPTVVFLLDHSSSMDASFPGPGGASSLRWDEMHRALTGLNGTGGVINDFADEVVFAATFYDSDDGNDTPPCPALRKVSIGNDVASQVHGLFIDDGFFPENDLGLDTPTAESLADAYGTFPAGTTPTAPRVLVLATDGNPDSCEDPDSNSDTAPRIASENAIVAGFSGGIQTFIISVGNGPEESHLNRMARAGLGQNLDNGNAAAIVATDSAALGDAFGDIVQGIRTCIINVEGSVTQPESGTITLNDTPLIFGEDWQLNDPTTIELIGDTCTTFQETENVQLSARFPCDGVVIQ